MKFDSYHPIMNFIYFAAAIGYSICFRQPVFLGISLLCGFLYSIKLGGVKQLGLNVVFLAVGIFYTGWYAYYNHFGVTNLRMNFIGNQITLESVVCGLMTGLTISAVLMWLSCVFMLITADKIVYLFGRVSPKLSLLLSILLRTVPRVGKRAQKIEIARAGIGRGKRQGGFIERTVHFVKQLSILITWTLENFVESAVSMKSRGYSLKGRTAFSIYRFDNRDRGLVIGFFWCMTLVMMAVLLDQTKMYFDPIIIINPITILSYVFYGAYTVFLLLPMTLQVIGEYRFKRLVEK